MLPRAVVDEEIANAGRREKRVRDLPSHVVAYYLVAMCVFTGVGVCEVLRWLLHEARGLFGADAARVVTSGGICSARSRLGKGVMEALCRRVAVPVAVAATPGAWHAGLRLMALDGSTLDLQDTAANAAHFGYPSGKDGDGAFPQARFAALAELGTHVIFGARVAPFAASEIALAHEIVAGLRPDMLCVADRLFFSYNLWNKAAATGAQLLWRVRGNLILPVEKRLPDGSWLSRVYPGPDDRRRKTNGVAVRAIRYRLKGDDAPAEEFLLLTTLLDHAAHPAQTLAALYPHRWEIETAYDEFKTHLRGGRVVLRSKTPDMVEQEFHAFILAHYCVRGLMHEAALAHGMPPLRLSYKHSVEVVKRHLPALEAGFSPTPHRPAPPRGLP